ncbi:MAG: hypothetical protein R3F59_38050, partial [Myxococcota bacterium]
WIRVGDLAPLLTLPRLQRLYARGGGIRLDALAHDGLRSLTLETGGLPADTVRAVAAGRGAALEHLELWFGSRHYGADAALADVAPLLHSRAYPALRRLGLRNAELADELAEQIVSAPIAAQLTALDLSLGVLGDAGALALARGADRLAGLEVLDVSEGYVGEAGLAALREAFGPRLRAGRQRRPHQDERYVSVGE